MGDVGIEEELDLLGIQHLGGPGDADHKVELKAGYAMPHDSEVELICNPKSLLLLLLIFCCCWHLGRCCANILHVLYVLLACVCVCPIIMWFWRGNLV